MIVSGEVRIPREVHTLLTRNDYPVVEARCGEDALLKLRQGRPNLILLDLDMAAGRWFDVCREIRSETSVPVLMLSAQKAEQIGRAHI